MSTLKWDLSVDLLVQLDLSKLFLENISSTLQKASSSLNTMITRMTENLRSFKVGYFETFSLSAAAPHHKSVLGSPGLSPLHGLWSCTVHFTSGAPSCQPAATLPAGNCNCGERGKRCGQADDAITARFLRHCRVYPHHQGKLV